MFRLASVLTAVDALDGVVAATDATVEELKSATVIDQTLQGAKGVSSRQSCESCEVQVLVPLIACGQADSISDACEGNDARSART